MMDNVRWIHQLGGCEYGKAGGRTAVREKLAATLPPPQLDQEKCGSCDLLIRERGNEKHHW
jgi:hypothetical protein